MESKAETTFSTPTITPEETAKLEDFKKKVEEVWTASFTQYDSNKEYFTNNDTLYRFACGHDFKLDVAIEKWKGWVEWYNTYRPDLIREDEETIKKQAETGKMFWHCVDKQGRPILYYRMRYHQKNLGTVDELIRFFVYTIEKGCKIADENGSRRIVVIYDRTGFNKKNYDESSMNSMKKVVPILQDYYPERLQAFFVIGANWFYRMMYDVVKTFVSNKTIKKVVTVGDMKELLTYISKENLSVEYGGMSDPQQVGSKTKLKILSLSKNYGDDVVQSDSEDERQMKKIADKMFSEAGIKKPDYDNIY
mmetsp:Transcript_83472/g.97597  ORF Transcript_83472/g.97597 Transcript_83472/m.97597 type:complete len:307 (+) Transcript_83472:30-950(+)